MSEMDELLQQQLEALEKGQELDHVLEELPEEASELGALISLASALRTMPHPQPQLQGSLAATQIASEERRTRPVKQKQGFVWTWPRVTLAVGVVGVTVFLIFALVSLSALGLWLAGPRHAHEVTLMDVAGVVGVGPADSNEGWELVSDGMQAREGQRIRTGSQGSVTLVFFDGSHSTLGPNTDLTLSKVDGSWGNVLRVELKQGAGDTNHTVVPLHGKKSAYQVQTPSGMVSVRGTVFSVSVDESGQARYAVDTGKVMVTSQDSEVILEAGQATTAQPGQALESPAYQFKLEGIVTDDEGDTWAVNGVEFLVTGETQYEGNPEYGSYVEVKGHIGEGGVFVADKIEVTSGGDVEMSFTGVVDSIGEGAWQISGVTVQINKWTEIDDNIAKGDPVEVTFVVVDQQWWALRIEALEEEEEVDDPEPEETDLPVTEPITPTEIVTQTLITDCTGANPHPKALKLAEEYQKLGVDVTDEVIMGWFCQRFGFGEIDLAYSLSLEHGVLVTEVFQVRRERRLGWGQIKKDPSLLDSSETVTDTEPTDEGEPSTQDEAAPSCMGKEAKKAENLARQIGVGYQYIVNLHCNGGFSIQDIDQAYKLSRRTGADVDLIIVLRSQGKSWDAIQMELAPKPKPNPQPAKPNPKPDKPKPNKPKPPKKP